MLGRGTHGIGLTLVIDPNVQSFEQTDSTLIPQLSWSGTQVNSSYKILIDKELIAGKLFGAINVQFDQIWTERPAIVNPQFRNDYVRNSNLTLSGALSYQLVDGLFVGAETRYVRTHNGISLNTFTGDALYVGPTFFWQASKSIAVMGAWGAQVAGDTKAIPGTILAPQLASSKLNLATQNQHIAKVKIGISF